MIHGPCGIQNPKSPCMKNGKCKKGYPKPFSEVTYQGNDSYPIYKWYDTNNLVLLNAKCNIMTNNSWVWMTAGNSCPGLIRSKSSTFIAK